MRLYFVVCLFQPTDDGPLSLLVALLIPLYDTPNSHTRLQWDRRTTLRPMTTTPPRGLSTVMAMDTVSKGGQEEWGRGATCRRTHKEVHTTLNTLR